MIYFISITLISVSLGIAFGLLARKRKKNANYCPHYYYGCYCPMCRNSIDKEWKNKFEEWKKISNKPEIEINANGKFWKNKEGKSHREDGPACEYANGDKYWYLNGKLHREDGPAVEHANEAKFWYLNDKLHREDGPAIEWSNGNKYWYKEGKRHREDGPAIEYVGGEKCWYLNGINYTEEEWKKELNKPEIDVKGSKFWKNKEGKYHRTDGPAIEYANGTKYWCLNNKLHREDGPAIEYANGTKYWYLNGKLHRTDGPAVECANGTKLWYLNDKRYNEEEWKKELNKPEIDVKGSKFWKNKEGKYHRTDGPAIEWSDGAKFWCLNNKLHREDGPAIEWSDGAKFWYKEGKSHREDGPACEYANGDKYWYLNGKRYNEEEWKKELNKHQKPVLNKPPTFKSEEEPIKSPEEPKSAELITHNLNWYVRKSINGKTHYLTNTGQWKLYKDYQNYLHLYPELTFLYKFQAQEMLAKITKKEIAKNKIPKLNEVIVKFKNKKVSNLEEIFGKIDFENTNQISKTVFVNPDDAIDYGTYSQYGLMELTISKNCHTNEAIYYRFSPLRNNESAYTRHKANNFYEAFC